MNKPPIIVRKLRRSASPDRRILRTRRALFALLRWWVESGRPYAPEAMDGYFHRLAGPGGIP